jgi:hypothetical protein
MPRKQRDDFNSIGSTKKERFFVYERSRPVRIVTDDTTTTCYTLDFKNGDWHWKVDNRFLNLSYEKSERWKEVDQKTFNSSVPKFKRDTKWQFEGETDLTPPTG